MAHNWSILPTPSPLECRAEIEWQRDSKEYGPGARLSVKHDGFAEYLDTFTQWTAAEEEATLPLSDYLDYQLEITGEMRRSLVEWLRDIKDAFNLSASTLALGVNICDRYLSRRSIPKRDYQLLGITSLFVASKYIELPRGTLTVANVMQLCCKQYCPWDLQEMERRLLDVIGFDLSWKSPGDVLDILTGQPGSDDTSPRHRHYGPVLLIPEPPISVPKDVVELAHSVIETSLAHSRFLGLRSATVAVSAMIAADKMLIIEGKAPSTCLTQLILQKLASLFPIEPRVLTVADHLLVCHHRAQGRNRGEPVTPPPDKH
ncbi:cyclin-like protein [Gonapodya prolifera JEL478]|uniref:Cyclin-like protein n=1 Tax=Gonapodya prolifera (strain JEL478) TaxID=1344416 RepID=A0A139A803_GONPJ|nr:cyclin-like protein [Gonapodya prolifera JEL478]|eukprot:KXS12941.1 cyclin-like protein [Gonapodya prolifera JEL478]